MGIGMNICEGIYMKKILGVVMAGFLAIGLTACGGGVKIDETASEYGGQVHGTATPAVESAEPTEEQPLVIDKEAKTIKVYATVNGKYTLEPTRHGLNYHEGNFGDEALFTSYANQTNFHDALIDIDATPGNNLGGDSDDEYIEGAELEVTVSWEGAERAYDINEVVNVSSGNPIAYKFGGNRANSVSKFTGCLMCFDSCPVGVTSNSSESMNAFDNKEVEFIGNKDLLPEDGTPVVVTFALK